MSVAVFLMQLKEQGRVAVPAEGQSAAEELNGVRQVLAHWDLEARLDMPGTPPPFDPSVGEWAATLLYRGCQFFVCRGVDAEVVIETLALPCPARLSASAAYSADLTFRFLPDLFAMAVGKAREDPLVESLRQLGRTWPLSSVGIPGLGEGLPVTHLIEHPSLLQTYVDRIIERQDLSRLQPPAVREAVQGALGMYADRYPKLAGALEPKPQDAATTTALPRPD